MTDENTNDNETNNETNNDQGNETRTWEAVLEGLPEDVRALYDEHIQGLRSALDAERGQRRDLARQLREATQGLEEGSQARDALESVTARLEAAEQRAAFFEEAARPEIGCTNPRLAYLAAQEIEAFDRRGNPNWDVLKKQFPELFRKTKTPSANAGSGADQTPKGGDMNAFIRRSAGRL